MKGYSILIITLVLSCLAGCSMPAASLHGDLYSITREEKISKGGFMGRKKSVTIKDFRGNEAYEEEMEDLKKDAEEYISQRPDLSDSAKNNLRELKVTRGSAADEVIFLLGKPDKRSRASGSGKYGATEIWVYRTTKLRMFTLFIFPVFPVHEGYYLYFKDGKLVEIERHYLEQVIRQGAAPGVIPSK